MKATWTASNISSEIVPRPSYVGSCLLCHFVACAEPSQHGTTYIIRHTVWTCQKSHVLFPAELSRAGTSVCGSTLHVWHTHTSYESPAQLVDVASPCVPLQLPDMADFRILRAGALLDATCRCNICGAVPAAYRVIGACEELSPHIGCVVATCAEPV